MFLNLTEAGKAFPKPISSAAVLRKIRFGNRGVKLQAQFDGYRYVTKQEWIDEFVRDVSQTRPLRSPIPSYEKTLELLRALKPTAR